MHKQTTRPTARLILSVVWLSAIVALLVVGFAR
jgi:hypothetical protein